jgi:protein phosphatase
MIAVESGGMTHPGMKRKGNEDTFLLNDQLKLYIVADGMGGHNAGEVASGLVVKTISDYMERFQREEEVEELEPADALLSRDANRLVSGIYLTNRVVHQFSNSKVSYKGMGSTVSAVTFTKDTIIAVNVGDSPIYLVRNGKIEQLSITHTVYAEHQAMNVQGGVEFGKEFSHMLTRAMGVDEQVKADVCEIHCFADDIIVVGSDGLTNLVEPEEIQEVVLKKKPEKACRQLIDLANDRGGDDNITVVILKVKSVKKKKKGFKKFFP